MKASIEDILKQYWGYDTFRSLQKEIILSVISGRDTLALMPTGGGKSITYQVPAMVMEGVCVVITPLIALMKDQVEELNIRNIPAEAIYTGMTAGQIESAINKTIGGKVKFLYISPERLTSEHFRLRLRQMQVSILAVDEAHCISQWGYDFRPSYLRIAEIREWFPQVPVLALTATATPQVAEDIQAQLKFAVPHVLSKSFRRDNISYVVRKVNDKLGELLHILSKLNTCAIVYVRKRATTEELANFLIAKGIRADFYHAGLSSIQRAKKQENWKNDLTPVIVATNAFGMGIDKPDVRVVVHFDIPDSPEAYFQESGRAGRDGERAYAVLLYNDASLAALKKRIVQGFPEKEYVREIYRNLGDFFGLEEGDGGGMAFEFNPDLFIKTFKVERVKVFSVIRILQVAGYIECTTEVHARSRICFLVLRDQLYKIELDHFLQERLVEFILRTCAGVFVQYAYIDEEYLAEKLGVKREDVYENLLALAKRKIISYVPGNDRPYIVYYQPRVPASYLHIGRNAYEDRKQAYSSKIQWMVGYLEACGDCRQLYLMKYFGQEEKKTCGVCDLCLSRKKQGGHLDKAKIDQAIVEMLQQKDFEINDLLYDLGGDKEVAIERIRGLLEDNKVYYVSPTVLRLKK
ncbi:MAG: ATP-dependent DNA helicase RecQ [Odoribacter sp.]